MGLRTYNEKRNFKLTPEPAGKKASTGRDIFVIQKHDASHLHYDFRLELDGALKSWAIPKGPSLNPGEKRLAMQVEDHPIDYAKFEGIIPAGEYGGGEVVVWDYGTWKPVGDAREGYRKGRLEFELKGKKLHGKWLLVRTRAGSDRAQWLLLKRHDEAAASPSDIPVTEAEPQSVLSGKLLTRDQEALGAPGAKSIAKRAKTWSSNRGAMEKPKTAAKSATKRGAAPEKKAPARMKGKVLGAKVRGAKKKVVEPALTFVEPQLATLVDAPPIGDRWIHEIKYDGYRTLCQVRNAESEPPVFYTRKGLDWSHKYETFYGEVSRLPIETAVLDGEVVATDEEGRTDFQLLQIALGNDGSTANLTFYVFDILQLNGRDLRDLPLIERKEILKAVFEKADAERIRYSDHWDGKGKAMLARGCEMGLEGVISKDKMAPYTSGRSELWVKSKCLQGQEVIIVGYTAPEGRRIGFGSLVLAANSPEGEFLYLGRVGTGFDHQKIVEIMRAMKPLRTLKSPFERRVPLENRIQWLKPKLVGEIFFHGWTAEGHVRQAVFRALRHDKPASEVMVDHALPSVKLPRGESPAEKKREKQLSKKAKQALEELPGEDIEEIATSDTEPAESDEEMRLTPNRKKKTDTEERLTLSNPEKVLIPEGKVTKRMIRDYLVAVTDWILPHMKDRPLALVRCPDGTTKECFFQKNLIHRGNGELKTQAILDPKGKKTSVIYVDSARGLESLAQMGTIELHAWGTHRQHVLKPDLIVFDLDPDTGVKWKQIAGAAKRLREILEGLGLRSFLKISGNKGLHLHVPIEPKSNWDDIKAFANAISLILVQENPKLYLANMSKAKRKGKIFIDFFRNGYGATSVVPYSVRTKNGGAVALPIDWSEVDTIDPAGFGMKKALARLKAKKSGGRGDPWKDYFSVRQRLPDFKGKAEAQASASA
jgi:bifunctional non-homologous end joining protein LigD